ncbi:hypothetical protein, partial [uncultured Helicobacter sp.]|uniref:hypothetical protein n=1 Tax=uncultured Helicobacter sp. TaxID=175537 RepID=UPI002604BA01
MFLKYTFIILYKIFFGGGGAQIFFFLNSFLRFWGLYKIQRLFFLDYYACLAKLKKLYLKHYP